MERKHILGISFVVVALFLFLATSDFSSLFTGKATSNIFDCKDSDNGITPNIKGYVTGSFTPYRPSNDFCVNSTAVGEYYCDKDKSDGMLKEIFCEFGCSDGACNPPKDETIVCDQGCPFNGECLPVSTRVSGKYCDYTQSLKVQKEGECENNYECKSNLCLSGQCLTEEGGKNFLKDVEHTYFWE